MRLFDKRRIFSELKKPQAAMNASPVSTQDLLEIKRISKNGIFEVGEGIYSQCFLLEDVNYTTKSFDEQVSFFGRWCKIINSFSCYVKLTVFNKNRDMEQLRRDVLYKKKNDGFDHVRSCYNDIIENKILSGKQGIEQVKIITISVEKNSYEEAKNALSTLENNLLTSLANIGSKIYPLDGTERLRLLFNFYRCGEEDAFDAYGIDVDRYMKEGICDWQNDIASSYVDFSEDKNSFRIGEHYCKALYAAPDKYPNSLTDYFFAKLANISSASLITVDFIPIPKNVVKQTLEDKLMGIEKTIGKQQERRNRQHAFSSDVSYQVRMEKKEMEAMLTDVRVNDQNMYWCSLSVVLIEKTKEKLSMAESTVKAIADEEGCTMEPYTNWQRQALNSALPIGVHQVDKYRTMFTQTAAILMPFNVQEFKPKKDPFYYGINQVSKNPILANRKYDLINGNGFVFGVPGAGKSFTGAKMEMGSVFVNTEDDIIVVDPTHEYFDVADAYGGAKIELSSHTTNYFNPMDIDLENLSVQDENGLIRDKCDFLISLCQQCMDVEFRPAHRSIIDRCAKSIYLEIAKLPPESRYQPILSDLYEELKRQDDREIRDITLALEVFVTGNLNVFNHMTNVDINNRIIVFGMRDLGDNLANIAMLVMLEYIKGRIIKNAERGRATWLYVDEFHVLCNKSYSRAYLISLWKKVRKVGGLCTGLTQNISDLLKDKDTATLVVNSEYTMFLKQGETDAEMIAKHFGLGVAQLAYVLNASPGTGLVRFDKVIEPLDNQIEKDNPIYDIYNTNFHEKQAMEEEKKRKGTEETIECA